MSTYIEELKKALEAFKSVKGDIAEIHRCKNEIQSLRDQLSESVNSGYFLRDESRLILSAPEVIIGNVDRSGMLISDGGSTVTLRGNHVALHGVSESGSVEVKAPAIRQLALDPGRDGLEGGVSPAGSVIVSQARSIAISSDDMIDACGVPPSGVQISSSTGISLNATPSNKSLSGEIDRITKQIDELESSISTSLSQYSRALDDTIKDMTDLTEEYENMSSSEVEWRQNDGALFSMQQLFTTTQAAFHSIVGDYMKLLSVRAENLRRKEMVKKIGESLKGKSADFTKKSAGGNICLSGESLSFRCVDGDGNIRENTEAGVYLHTPRIQVRAEDKTGALIKSSSVALNVENVVVSTASAKLDEKREKGDIPVGGQFVVNSKQIVFSAVDSEFKDKKVQEKALSKGGQFYVRTENFQVSSTDKEGKSTGEIKLNAKDISLASMDVHKEKRTDTKMAAGSRMMLLAEKMYTGATDKKNKSKLFQIVSDKVGIMADTTAEMQQGEAKAVVTLDGGNLTAGASKNEFNGDTTINGKADIKGETTAPKGTFSSLEASSQFKSPNISDGMGAGGGGAAGRPSAKMKMEEVQNQNQNKQ